MSCSYLYQLAEPQKYTAEGEKASSRRECGPLYRKIKDTHDLWYMLFVDTYISINSKRIKIHLNEKHQVQDLVTLAKTERRPEVRVQLVQCTQMSQHPLSHLCLIQASDARRWDQHGGKDGESGCFAGIF